MANKMKVWLTYQGIDDTYAYEFNDVPDNALIEASVQAAVQNFTTRINDTIGGQGYITTEYGSLFKYKGGRATGVARVTAESTHEVPITLTGGE